MEIGVGEIDDQSAIVVEHDRAEQQRIHPAEPQRQRGEEARVLVEQPVWPVVPAPAIALLVEHAEQIVVLQRPQGPVDERLGRLDMVAFRRLVRLPVGPGRGGDDFVHAVWASISLLPNWTAGPLPASRS